MKVYGLLLILSGICIAGQAQLEKPTDSKITAVTVFLDRAQVTRQVRTRVDIGRTDLIITGLTAELDPESIQVGGKGDIVILGISHRQNFLNDVSMPLSLQRLRDSIVSMQSLLELEKSQKEILDKEEEMLVSNQKIGGTNQNLTVAELKSMADFYRARLSDIVAARRKADVKMANVQQRITKLTLQLTEQNERYTRNTSEIVVSVSAGSSTAVSLELNYIVANAGWNPVYDLRATNTKSPVQLNYKANVFQSTGEEWHEVRLKLSTANPSQSGLKPELTAWYLNFLQMSVSDALQGRGAGIRVRGKASDSRAEVASLSEVVVTEAKSLQNFVTTLQTTLTTEFDIALPYTVKSAAKPTLVDIRSHDLKARYLYSAAPKLDRDAFLIAEATGWADFSLLPGEANIFFEGTFVGKTFIDPGATKDTLAISLGRDKRITIKRERLKELTSRKLIGTNKKESAVWEITVRNNKTEAIKIDVEDQVPVSQDSRIEVTTTDLGGAKYTKESGKLLWSLTLQPNEVKKLVFKYEVKYPKDQVLAAL